jgi:hypothetical protein
MLLKISEFAFPFTDLVDAEDLEVLDDLFSDKVLAGGLCVDWLAAFGTGVVVFDPTFDARFTKCVPWVVYRGMEELPTLETLGLYEDIGADRA